MRRFSAISVITMLMFGWCSARPATAAELPPVGPGVNLPDLSSGVHISRYDMKLIFGAGFRAVRQPVDGGLLIDLGSCKVNLDLLREVINRGRLATSAGLTFIFDLHPDAEWKERLFSAGVPSCLPLAWKKIASILKSQPPNVFFELLNEPGAASTHRWWALQEIVIIGIRSVDTDRVLLVSGEGSATAPDLISHGRYKESRLIYVFHDYNPMFFTHQGANWGSAARYKSFAGTGWPAAAGKAKIAEFKGLARVARWREKYNVAVICDEFGVYRNGGVSELDRNSYLRDLSSRLNSYGIPWIIWQYTGGFGITSQVGNKRRLDRATLRALGLHDK